MVMMICIHRLQQQKQPQRKHRRLLTVAVLMVVLCSNFVISQQQTQQQQQYQQPQNKIWPATITETNDTITQQQQQQQQQLQLKKQNNALGINGTTAAVTVTTTTTTTTTTAQPITTITSVKQPASVTTTTTLSSSSSSSSISSAAALATKNIVNNDDRNNNNNNQINIQQSTTTTPTTTTPVPSATKSLRNGKSVAEISIASSNSEDVVERSSISPTTYRPMRSAIAVHTTAQERERKLMNVLAARRSALHRGGFRRVGTTGRTATSAANLETTSKTPPDPRSICIRNCTKNFTRRTTASCMRQCANFTRTPFEGAINHDTKTGAIILRSSSKNGTNSQIGIERDTNEILFTDESSHGLFVVAKEQNGTANHIPDSVKGHGKNRSRQKPLAIASAATATAAAMILAPPTSIEDDDLQPYLFFGQKLPPLKPGLLTITSVSEDHPRLLEVAVSQPISTTTSASVVTATSTLSAVERSRSRYKYNHVRSGTVPFNRRFTGSGRPTSSIIDNNMANISRVSANESLTNETSGVANVTQTTRPVNVTIAPGLGALVKQETLQVSNIPTAATTTTTSKTTTTTGSAISNTPLFIQVLSEEEETPTTLVSTTKTTPTPVPTIMTRTWTTSTRMMTNTTPKALLTPTKTSTRTTATATTTSTSTATPKMKSFIEEDTEKLRAMAPTLTQEIKTDEKTNLIIFINRTSDMGFERDGLKSTVTTKRPRTSTDSYSTILRTTVLSSVRSTVNPPSQSATERADGVPVGLVEMDKGVLLQTGSEISSTVIANEPDVTQEMRRMNIATIVLACIGIFPLVAVIIYLMRTFVIRRSVKDDEVFDVCITDQQPISPVKKLDGKYQEQEEDDEEEHNMHHIHHNGRQNNGHGRERYDEQCSVTSQSDQEFDRSNIRLKSLLGEGNFGQVWKAEADDLTGHIGATRIVAVKTIRACSAQRTLKDEANIMRKLGSHPNVVTLLGACVESEPHMLIMEYAMRGRLLSLLRAARSASNILPASVPGGRSLTPLSPRTMAGFALDIACGMEYIAEKRIVHRDLAARNVLLDHNGVCKICDFGMSLDLDAERRRKEQEKNINNEIMRSNSNKFKLNFGSRFIMNQWTHNFPGHMNNQSGGQQQRTTESSEKRNHGNGPTGHDTFSKRHALPIRWMAPEALQYHIFTTETDVWAFGIVIWEIASLGSTPYSQLTGREVIRRVPNGLRPEIPKEGRRDFYNLMVRCWHKEPQMRPSFTQARLEISTSLHKYVDDESASSDYMDVSGFSEDLEHGMVYFNHRISEFECEI